MLANDHSAVALMLIVLQTGLVLMVFSRYCASSLDLTNFVVRSCCGAGRPCRNLGIGKSRNREIQILESGNLETWDPKKEIILKIKIRSVQNVGKVCISRKKNFPAPFWAIPGIFSRDRKNKKNTKFCRFSLVGQWALFTRFGTSAGKRRGHI